MTGWYRRTARAGYGRPGRPAAGEQDGDAVLVRAMAAGDEEALAGLWARHAASLLSYLADIAGDPGMAEEILQDTLLAAWRGAARFRNESSVRTWLFAIARRQAGCRVNRAGKLSWAGEEELAALPAPEASPEAVMVARCDVAVIGRAIGELSPVHREVLQLVFTHGLSVRETAHVLNVPTGTVKSRLSNARRVLAAALARAEEER